MAVSPKVIQGGVSFGNEALANYDEGTFSPGIAFGGASVGVSYSATRYGNYTRIGNRCFFNCYFVLTSKGSSVGAVTITGLPFTSASAANGGVTSIYLWASGVSVTNGAPYGYVNPSATTIALEAIATNSDAGAAAPVTNTNVSGTASVMISGSYIIA